MPWTLDIAGVSKTLAEWGLQNVSLRLINLGVDELLAERPGVGFDAAPICAYGASVVLSDPDGVVRFRGTRVLVPGQASGTAEGQSYSFAGPWYWLSRNLFKQSWRGGIGGVLTTIYTSHLILTGSVTSLIQAVLAYAQASGAPAQAGSINIPVTPPISEVVDKTCAATISDLLQFSPDAVGWWDYTVNPPAFNCQPRSALTSVTLSIPPAVDEPSANVSIIKIQPRSDLVVPSVEINYEVTNTVDGVERFGFYRDIWPVSATGREDGALSSVVNLQGFSATHVTNTLLCDTIDTSDLEWWKRMLPTLADERIQNLAFTPGFPVTRMGSDGSPSSGYNSRLMEGQCAEWMTNPDGSPLAWQEETIVVQLNYKFYDENGGPNYGKILESKGQILSITLMTCNAPAGETDYESLETFEDGDPIPSGLAQYLYGALSVLHYDVQIQTTEAECPATGPKPGNTLNLAGSQAAYASMAALVQETVFSIDQGTTDIVAGPPRHLSVTDVMTLLRANRVRRRWTNPATQTDGSLSGPSNVQLGQATAGANGATGSLVPVYLAAKDAAKKISIDATGMILLMEETGNAKKLNIDWASTTWGAAGAKELKVIEVAICKRINGVDTARRMLVIGTDDYA